MPLSDQTLDKLERQAILSAFGTFQRPTQWMICTGSYNRKAALLSSLREDTVMKKDRFQNMMLIIKRYILAKDLKHGGKGLEKWFTDISTKTDDAISREEWMDFQHKLLMWDLFQYESPYSRAYYSPQCNRENNSFVDVMVYAGRYVRAKSQRFGGNGMDDWYNTVAQKNVEDVTADEWERYERSLLLWVKLNPDLSSQDVSKNKEVTSMTRNSFVNVMTIARRYIMTKSERYGGLGMSEWFTGVINKSMELLTKAELDSFVSNILLWDSFCPDLTPVVTDNNGPHETFVNAMLIAGRYIKAKAPKYGGQGMAPWFMDLLHKGGCENISRAEWETFERHIIAWACVNPIQPARIHLYLDGLDTYASAIQYCHYDMLATMNAFKNMKIQEEKKTMITKFQEITGLKMGEIFTIANYSNLYRLIECDRLETLPIGETKWSDGDYMATHIVNHPGAVERHPVMTEEQKKKILWLNEGNFSCACKDANGKVYAYNKTPIRNLREWYFQASTHQEVLEFCHIGVDCLSSLIPDWEKRLDVAELATWVKRIEAATTQPSLWKNVGANGLWREVVINA